jgi:hypothetical protein
MTETSCVFCELTLHGLLTDGWEQKAPKRLVSGG